MTDLATLEQQATNLESFKFLYPKEIRPTADGALVILKAKDGVVLRFITGEFGKIESFFNSLAISQQKHLH